ncbi:hypothetical protein HAX54_009681 [Datura stramonium]|uniref:Leucine-rich repeat-containing N-terminal plant-type domain-containing protein n=1 Tax=Datura stramonium TaxID=4076 RepID=A0ABS8WVI4_DATST|nr:hypothetical protein [Datura stramonium]
MKFLMWVFKIVFILTLFHLFSSSLSLGQEPEAAPVPICAEADRLALLGFKAKILKDTTDFLSSWTGTDCCGGGWEGVECDPATGRVTRLILQNPSQRDPSIYMKGVLSPTLGDLHFLETMIISG